MRGAHCCEDQCRGHLYAVGDTALTKHLRQFEDGWYPCTPLIDKTHLFHAMTNAAGIARLSP